MRKDKWRIRMSSLKQKKYFDDHKAPDNNLVQTTLNNTLKNKFVGKKEEDELNN